MNGLKSTDEAVECPLCMEPLEVDDLNFFPCTCGYQICRFCWHRIRTDENELCPACRKEYPENPADFTPLTQEEMIAFKSQKRQRDQQRKQKVTENRKHLANVRVVQKNLVFVVGLPPRLADADILKKHEYFGKYGKIHKVVINPSTTYAGVQGPSASAYVTYVNNSDALRAIQSVNNIMIDGRLIKTSLGTTKYCSHFMKNQQCPKGDCMYLHELGDSEASFTKEEMHQGKHQEYEKRLHDSLIAASGSNGSSNASTIGIGSFIIPSPSGSANNNNNGDCNKTANSCSSAALTATSQTLSSSSSSPSVNVTSSSIAPQQKDAWPSLAISPDNVKEGSCISSGHGNGRNKKDKVKNDKTKSERGSKNIRNTAITQGGKERTAGALLSTQLPAAALYADTRHDFTNSSRSKPENKKEKSASSRNTRQLQKQRDKRDISSEDELSLLHGSEKCISNDSLERRMAISPENHFENKYETTTSETKNHRSISSSSNISSSSGTNSSNSSIGPNSDNTPALSDSTSGKSSPGNFPELFSSSKEDPSIKFDDDEKQMGIAVSFDNSCSSAEIIKTNSNHESKAQIINFECANTEDVPCNDVDKSCKEESLLTCTPSVLKLPPNNGSDDVINAIDLSKMNLFDDSNSFFSSATMFQPPTRTLKTQIANDMRQNHTTGAAPHLPDLLNGIDGYLNNTNEWEEAFQDFGMRNMKTIEGQLEHHQYNRQEQQKQHAKHHHDHSQQEECLRIRNWHKQHSINNMETSQINAPHNDLQAIHNYQDSQEHSRQSQPSFFQLQQLAQQHATHMEDHAMGRNIFGTNMLKFFDFHKNQQQQQINQQFLVNGQALLNEHEQLVSLAENSRYNHFQPTDLSNGRFQNKGQVAKQRLLDHFDTMQSQNLPSYQQPQHKYSQNCVTKESLKNASADDDLGFDPFIETQKALAELMEHEVVEKQGIHLGNNKSVGSAPIHHQPQQRPIPEPMLLDNSQQRTRMPPPGFNHMNSFGFGLPRAQNTSNMMPNIVNIVGVGPLGAEQDMQQNLQQISHPWSMGTFQQPQHSDQQHVHQLNPNANYNKAYTHNDWTAMDPAILSLRQFSAFPLPPQTSHHSADMFLQNLPHQQQQQQPQNGQGFTNQPMQGNVNLPNASLNSPQTSQAQVNANVQGMLEFLKTRQFV